MSTILGTVASSETVTESFYSNNKLQLYKSNYIQLKHIRKSKENLKCSRELKNKLKKYKLRRDGLDDQEVLDVSKILVTRLRIKSPNNKEDKLKYSDETEDEVRPKNYLFKMGRRKQALCKTESNTAIVESNISTSIHFNILKNNDIKTDSEVVNCCNVKTDDNSDQVKDKKQTNVFRLMMDSRSKSIGGNSPGKERVIDQNELQETLEKKKLKAKRSLVLQKMAEQKGSLKKEEIEDYQDKLVKKKMEKRAERLKDMIKNHDKSLIKPEKCEIKKESKVLEKNKKINTPPTNKKLKLVNLFEDSDFPEQKLKNKILPADDDEFLKKLSPSLKKQENMLCYFRKVEKVDDVVNCDSDIDDNKVNEVIKVKLAPKMKKKLKKKKLSLNKELTNSNLQTVNSIETDYIIIHDNGDDVNELSKSDKRGKPLKENKKRKENHVDKNKIMSNEVSNNDISRPRRNIKRPAKYIEEAQLTSSDEELHIFTPKKKRQVENKDQFANKALCNDSNVRTKIDKKKELKKNGNEIIKDDSSKKKMSKLAPIFNAKPNIDAAAIEAKQRFLSSGVPDKLRKVHEKQKNQTLLSNIFYPVVHVQQIEYNSLTREVMFNLKVSDEEFVCNFTSDNNIFGNLLLYEKSIDKSRTFNSLGVKNKPFELIHKIKESYPKFPVYRTYHLLKDKSRGEFRGSNILDFDNSVEMINCITDINNDNPETLNWTDKYKPLASKEILGNFDTVKELKKWLVSWTENDTKTSKHNVVESDSSDFYISDTDSKDSIKTSNNLLVLTGPIGSGKTSMVYAVAAELAIKVLEVNASSKRTGKIMLQDLQEATQSHKVNRGKTSSQEASQKINDIIEEKENKKRHRGKSKKLLMKKIDNMDNCEQLSQSSRDGARTCMSLILIDDADIVFDQDDGFCSAIVQLVHCSKRPVVLITSTTTCPHLQRFLNSGKIMHTRPLLPNMLGTWLDIMCLAENSICWPGLGTRILDYYHGDIRKAINCLQFYLSKDRNIEKETDSQSSNCYKINIEDENSNMGWSDSEGRDEKNEPLSLNQSQADLVWQYFMSDQINLLKYTYPIRLLDIWWNIPALLNIPCELNDNNITTKEKCIKVSTNLEAVANALDFISIADYLRKSHKDNTITDDPWHCIESHSVSEQGNSELYSKYNEVIDEISHSLVTGGVKNVQNKLGLPNKTHLNFPSNSDKRDREKVVSRHHNLTKHLNPSAVLDRRSLALDYWSSSRTICRIERMKNDTNTKRNNRFCHYLKSVNMLCNNDTFENLCSSLCASKDDY